MGLEVAWFLPLLGYMNTAWILEFDEKVRLGHFEDARSVLRARNPATSAEHRQLGNLEGKLLLHQGQHDQALQALVVTRSRFGSHLKLVCDIAAGHYLLGQFARFREAAIEVEKNWEQNQSRLSPRMRIEVIQCRARFLEELGETKKAISLLKSLLIEERMEPLSRYDRLIIKANILRILTAGGKTARLGGLYSELMLERENEIGQFMMIEVHQALITAELAMQGPRAGLARMYHWLETSENAQAFSRLVLFDVMDLLILHSQEVPRRLLELAEKLEPADEYEKEILALANSRNFNTCYLRLNRLSSELSPAGYFRILTLCLAREPDTQVRTELHRRLHACLEGMDRESAAFWRMRSGIAFSSSGPQSQERCILIMENEKALLLDGQRMDLSRRDVALKVMRAFSKARSFSPMDLASRVWPEASFNESVLFRIKTAVTRVNQLLVELTGNEKVIHFQKDQIRLMAGFQIALNVASGSGDE